MAGHHSSDHPRYLSTPRLGQVDAQEEPPPVQRQLPLPAKHPRSIFRLYEYDYSVHFVLKESSGVCPASPACFTQHIFRVHHVAVCGAISLSFEAKSCSVACRYRLAYPFIVTRAAPPL